jgi:hypothetical protein
MADRAPGLVDHLVLHGASADLYIREFHDLLDSIGTQDRPESHGIGARRLVSHGFQVIGQHIPIGLHVRIRLEINVVMRSFGAIGGGVE